MMNKVRVVTKDDQTFIGNVGVDGFKKTIDYCFEWMQGEAVGVLNAEVLQLVQDDEVVLFFRHDVRRMTVIK